MFIISAVIIFSHLHHCTVKCYSLFFLALSPSRISYTNTHNQHSYTTVSGKYIFTIIISFLCYAIFFLIHFLTIVCLRARVCVCVLASIFLGEYLVFSSMKSTHILHSRWTSIAIYLFFVRVHTGKPEHLVIDLMFLKTSEPIATTEKKNISHSAMILPLLIPGKIQFLFTCSIIITVYSTHLPSHISFNAIFMKIHI